MAIYHGSKDAMTFSKRQKRSPPADDAPVIHERPPAKPTKRAWRKNKATSEHELVQGDVRFAVVYREAKKSWRWTIGDRQSEETFDHWRSARKAAETELEG
jgi:hypothetical protein